MSFSTTNFGLLVCSLLITVTARAGEPWATDVAPVEPVSQNPVTLIPDAGALSGDSLVSDGGTCSPGCVCDCRCRPRSSWRVSADAIFLQRSTPDARVLMQDTLDPSRNLNAQDFDFDFEAGWGLSLLYDTGCRNAVELRYFAVDGWNASTTATTNSTLLDPLRINTNPPTFAPNVQTIAGTYGSELASFEINWRRKLSCACQLLAGFRYLELDEAARFDLNAAPQFFQYNVTTQNRLYGFQLGTDAVLYSQGRWTIDGLIKAGIYQNSSSQSTLLDTGVVQRPARGESDRAAFVGEMSFAATYCVTSNISLRAGYDLLWLDTVALASDQIPATNLIGQTGIAEAGDVFYHGAFIGVSLQR